MTTFKTAQAPKGLSVSWEPSENRENYKYLGDNFTGIYIEKKTDVGENHSNIYKFDVDGEMISLWGSAIIDDAFSCGNGGREIPLGSIVRITNQGMQKSQKGGRTYRKILVEFAEPTVDFKSAGTEPEAKPSPEADDLGY